jgi:septation ring formation regulator EzrA
MSYNEISKIKDFFFLLILLLIGQFLPIHLTAATDEVTDTPALSDNELQSLQETLSQLKSLSPKLRVLLRTLRRQAGFDPTAIHKIERRMSQSERDLERMIAMHQRNAFNKLRAHFMADDLRRKSQGLKESLDYVKRHIQKLNEVPGDRKPNEQLQKSDDDLLLEMLGLYTDLVSQSVTLLRGKLI